MSAMNRCEGEIDAIRLQLYEESKNLTPEEESKQIRETTKKLAAEFGFKIGKPTRRAEIDSSKIV